MTISQRVTVLSELGRTISEGKGPCEDQFKESNPAVAQPIVGANLNGLSRVATNVR